MPAVLALQLRQYPSPQIAHIRRPFAQIGVIHHLEVAHVGIHHGAQGPLGPLALANMHNHFGG